MIGTAVYALLNVDSLTDLGVSVYHTVAPQAAELPFVIMNERGRTENHKDGYSIINHSLQIDVYCEHGKEGVAGFTQANTIALMVESLLNRQKGVFQGVDVDTIYLVDQQAIYDTLSQAARVISEYNLREKTAPPLAPVAAVNWMDDLGNMLIDDLGDNLIFGE